MGLGMGLAPDTLLDVRGLEVVFAQPDGPVYAVNGASFHVRRGEWLGILGESGSGKSVSLLSILGLLGDNGRVTAGEAWFDGEDLLRLPERHLRTIRGRRIGVVFQSVSAGLNPFLRVGAQVMEPMLQHHFCGKAEARQRALALLAEMGIPDPETRFHSFPFELSGGMRQRVMTAVALACDPDLLIADEPTTALDTTVQVQVLRVLRDACARRRMATIMVTHDIGVAANVCDRVLVMYAGMVMEVCPIDEFIERPAHPYTLALRASHLDVRHRRKPLVSIPGTAPVLREPPRGCPFAERCAFAADVCRRERPPLMPLAEPAAAAGTGAPSDRHWVACHRAKEVVALGDHAVVDRR
ncbi:peptide ABC transporter ATP-binding protein [Alicyclobacillus cellulosilyticus]|uniref:Peptide ABC transporter ATP-binding protein n=1 Tax=Alicyclobacillus cellulosilyticus TaxID=1003997 RepID=A0A917NPR9_9BACL|nr:ABC transporter ATP-binding protein [Alicyclobacillus cellulosilyticus]GGJ13634.1 peptide ABC transporter ATP-binding protein [Alicyclobacillus cellulosilyticus]